MWSRSRDGLETYFRNVSVLGNWQEVSVSSQTESLMSRSHTLGLVHIPDSQTLLLPVTMITVTLWHSNYTVTEAPLKSFNTLVLYKSDCCCCYYYYYFCFIIIIIVIIITTITFSNYYYYCGNDDDRSTTQSSHSTCKLFQWLCTSKILTDFVSNVWPGTADLLSTEQCLCSLLQPTTLQPVTQEYISEWNSCINICTHTCKLTPQHLTIMTGAQ